MHHQQTVFLVRPSAPFLRQGYVLNRDPEVRLGYVPAFQQFTDDALDGFGRQGDNRLPREHGSIDPNQLTAAVNQRATGLAGIKTDIGTQEATNLTSAPGLPWPSG